MSETQKHIGSMWSVVGVATLYISLNICLFSHGSEFLFPGIRLEATDPHSAALYGIFFMTPLVLTTHYLTRFYARNYPCRSWCLRFPVAFNRNLSETAGFLKMYQVFFGLAILILPSLLHIDYFNKFVSGSVYIQDSGEVVLVDWGHFALDCSILENREYWSDFRYGDLEKGMDYMPFATPFLVILLEIAHVMSFVFTAKALLKKV